MPLADAPSPDALAFAPRQRDRRRGVGDVIAAVARGVADRADAGLIRGAFEDALRRVLPVRSVTLREATSRWLTSRTQQRPEVDSVAFEVPAPTPTGRGILETTFDAGCRMADWDFQVLAQAAQLGALVLELERARAKGRPAAASIPAMPPRDGAAPLIGSTAVMSALRAKIERVAHTDFTVLLEGESGVGKELVARQVHDLSHRRNGPFVAINCAALVETLLEAELFGIEDRTATGVRGRRGKFEHADGGTLFLDEVSDLSMSAQAKLLRAIQDLAVERVGSTGTQRVDIRIVAATNRSLQDMVDRRLFRPDLYYRLGGVDIRVPPLRERRSDIEELTGYFFERHRQTRVLRLADSAREALMLYDWPGNVRELERLIERVVALAERDVIEVDDLPACVRGEYAEVLGPSLRRGDSLRAWAGRYARLVLDRCKGNKRETARVLGISYHTLNSYLRGAVASTAPHDADPEAVAAEDTVLADT
jgi:transcriptional regulator with PAS, ATPase and Fis domain